MKLRYWFRNTLIRKTNATVKIVSFDKLLYERYLLSFNTTAIEQINYKFVICISNCQAHVENCVSKLNSAMINW